MFEMLPRLHEYVNGETYILQPPLSQHDAKKILDYLKVRNSLEDQVSVLCDGLTHVQDLILANKEDLKGDMLDAINQIIRNALKKQHELNKKSWEEAQGG